MLHSLNENIKRLRIARGMNQVEFARLIGVTKQCVSNWENDNVIPSIEMLVKIADAFNVKTDLLLGREGEAFIFNRAKLFTRKGRGDESEAKSVGCMVYGVECIGREMHSTLSQEKCVGRHIFFCIILTILAYVQ